MPQTIATNFSFVMYECDYSHDSSRYDKERSWQGQYKRQPIMKRFIQSGVAAWIVRINMSAKFHIKRNLNSTLSLKRI